ncbi:MAG: hypothetical protein QOF78_23 [Phycisphaerales bacterium]|jgi:hypothetical protein|nr:hypothetical protein [Phycisphaerales bacterium]
MTREEFWEIIDAARAAAMFDRRRLPEALRAELAERAEDEVLEFIRLFNELRIESFRQELFAAAWIAGGGAGEEDFSDFRDWLITLGREAFEDAMHDPQRILDHAEPADLKDPFDPEIAALLHDLHEIVAGPHDTMGSLRRHPPRPAGREWQPQELARRFPKLWTAYNP